MVLTYARMGMCRRIYRPSWSILDVTIEEDPPAMTQLDTGLAFAKGQ